MRLGAQRPPTLRTTLVLVVTILIAVHLFLDIATEILIGLPARTEQRQLEAARQLIDKVQQTLATDIALGNRSNAQQIISIQATDPNVKLLTLLDQHGVILYSTRYADKMRKAEEVIADFRPEVYSNAIRNRRLMISTLPGGEAITAYAPLPLSSALDKKGPRQFGVIFLRYDLVRAKSNALRQALSPGRWPGWIMSLVLSALAILYLLNRTVSRPLHRLEEIVAQTARGEAAPESGFTGSGEIAQLGLGIDRMRREIEHSHAQLQRANQELEIRVVERTRHLQREIELRERAELLLSASERQLQIVLNNVTDGVALWNAERQLQYANPAFRHLLGMQPCDDGIIFDQNTRLLGDDGEELPADHFPVARTLQDGLLRTGVIVALERPEEDQIWLNVNAVPVTSDDADDLRGVVASISDITDLKSHEELLNKLANFDPLTNLPNRRLLHDRMRQLVEHTRRQEKILAVAYLDLDGFKEINDRFGHKCGDRLLIEAAGRLSHCVRAGDTVARLGGDEFVLLLTDIVDMAECEAVLQRVLRTLANPYTLNGESKQGISASIGVTLFPADDSDPDTLLRHADRAMYGAKKAGRNRLQWFDSRQESRIQAQRDTLLEIEQALRRGEFTLFYQPKISCRTLRVVGVEALLRWRHPILGILPPSHFLPLIQDKELALPVGEFVICEAMRQAHAWGSHGLNLPVSVNLFARQLQQRGFVDSLARCQKEIGGNRRTPLEIEIIENAALEGIRDLPGLVARCAEMGVTFSLDDFGTGYSTLDHLRRIPAQALKIDRSFISNLLTSDADRTLVEATIGLGRAFGRRIIAEGVEQTEQLRWLRAAGCDEMQGYLFARPMEATAISQWITSYRPDPAWTATPEELSISEY
ncbi:MAG: EAL domain-containing protein [Gammaproteobacteria bacterium]|nr:EAL domain-containing protein [Gammaproteobacteria bacterium]